MKTNTIDIFCNIIDNFGDIGVSYRLAKEIASNKYIVHLYVDDLYIFSKIENKINIHKKFQKLSKYLFIHKWDNNLKHNYIPSYTIIETFGCNLPQYISNKITDKNLWINLEYLSAENWIEDCHLKISPQSNGLKKYFFFPGFTPNTGGLNFNKLVTKINKIKFLQKFSHHISNRKLKIKEIPNLCKNYSFNLIFTYDNPQVKNITISKLKQNPNSVFFIAEGKSSTIFNNNTIKEIKEKFPKAKLFKFKMINQSNFNKLINICDLVIVRGEDSIVQAIIQEKLFLWDIYKQEENAHLDKIKHFIYKYIPQNNKNYNDIYESLINLNTSNIYSNFDSFMLKSEEIISHNKLWARELKQNDSLCSNLLNFIKQINRN